MSLDLFAKQRIAVYQPPVKYDGPSDRVLMRAAGGETDITDRQIVLYPSTFRWGWIAYVRGQGAVHSPLVPISDPLPPAPSTPAGNNAKGQPAPWSAYACLECLVEGVDATCSFELSDRVMLETMKTLCHGVETPELTIQFAGSTMGKDAYGDAARLPTFEVL